MSKERVGDLKGAKVSDSVLSVNWWIQPGHGEGGSGKWEGKWEAERGGRYVDKMIESLV